MPPKKVYAFPPRTDFGPAPPGYIPGLGRGAKALQGADSVLSGQRGLTKRALEQQREMNQNEAELLRTNTQLQQQQQQEKKFLESVEGKLEEQRRLKKLSKASATGSVSVTTTATTATTTTTMTTAPAILTTKSTPAIKTSNHTSEQRASILDLIDPTLNQTISSAASRLSEIDKQAWYNLPDAIGIGSGKKEDENEHHFSAIDFAHSTSDLQALVDNAYGTTSALNQSIEFTSSAKSSSLPLIEGPDGVRGQRTTSFYAYFYHIFPTDLTAITKDGTFADPKITIKLLENKIKTNPSDAQTWLTLIQTEFCVGNVSEAFHKLKLALNQCKKSEELWLFAVRLYISVKKQLTEITPIIENGLKFVPASVPLWKLFIESSSTPQQRTERIVSSLHQFPNALDLWLVFFDTMSTPQEIISQLSEILFNTQNNAQSQPTSTSSTSSVTSMTLSIAEYNQITKENRLVLWKLLILYIYHFTCSSPADINAWLMYYTTHPAESYTTPQQPQQPQQQSVADIFSNQDQIPQHNRPQNPWEIGYAALQPILQQFLSQSSITSNFDAWLFIIRIESFYLDSLYFCTSTLSQRRLQSSLSTSNTNIFHHLTAPIQAQSTNPACSIFSTLYLKQLAISFSDQPQPESLHHDIPTLLRLFGPALHHASQPLTLNAFSGLTSTTDIVAALTQIKQQIYLEFYDINNKAPEYFDYLHLVASPTSSASKPSPNSPLSFHNPANSIHIFTILSNFTPNPHQLSHIDSPQFPNPQQPQLYDPIRKIAATLTGAFNVHLTQAKQQSQNLITFDYCLTAMKLCEQYRQFPTLVLISRIWMLQLIQSRYQTLTTPHQVHQYFVYLHGVVKEVANEGYIHVSRTLLLTIFLALIAIVTPIETKGAQLEQQSGNNQNLTDVLDSHRLKFSSFTKLVPLLVQTLITLDKSLISTAQKHQQNYFQHHLTNSQPSTRPYFTALHFWSQFDFIASYIYLINKITSLKPLRSVTTSLFLLLIDFFNQSNNNPYCFYILSSAHIQLKSIRQDKTVPIATKTQFKTAENPFLHDEYWASIAFYILAYQLKLKQSQENLLSPDHHTTTMTSTSVHSQANLMHQQQALAVLHKSCQDQKEPLLYLHLVQLLQALEPLPTNQLVKAIPKWIELLQKLLLKPTPQQLLQQHQQQGQNSNLLELYTKYRFLVNTGQLYFDSTLRYINHTQFWHQTYLNDTPCPDLTNQDQQIIGYYLATNPSFSTMWAQLLSFYFNQLHLSLCLNNMTLSTSQSSSIANDLLHRIKDVFTQCIDFYTKFLPQPSFFPTLYKYSPISQTLYQQLATSMSFLHKYHVPFSYTTSPLDFFLQLQSYFLSGLHQVPFLSTPITHALITQFTSTDKLLRSFTFNTALTFLENIGSSASKSTLTTTTFSLALIQHGFALDIKKSVTLRKFRWALSYILSLFVSKSVSLSSISPSHSSHTSLIKSEQSDQNSMTTDDSAPLQPTMSSIADNHAYSNPTTSQQHYDAQLSSFPITLRSTESTLLTIFPSSLVLNPQPSTAAESTRVTPAGSSSLNVNTDLASHRLTQALTELRPIFNAILSLAAPSNQNATKNSTLDVTDNSGRNATVTSIKTKITLEHAVWLHHWAQLNVVDLETKPVLDQPSALRALLDYFDLTPLLQRVQRSGSSDPFADQDASKSTFYDYGGDDDNDEFDSAETQIEELSKARAANAKSSDQGKDQQPTNRGDDLQEDPQKLSLPIPILLFVAKYLWALQKSPLLSFIWFSEAISSLTQQFGYGPSTNLLPGDLYSSQQAQLPNETKPAKPIWAKKQTLQPCLDLFSLPSLSATQCIHLTIPSTNIVSFSPFDITRPNVDPIIAQQLYSPTILPFVPLSQQSRHKFDSSRPSHISLGLYPQHPPVSSSVPLFRTISGDVLIWFFNFLSEQCASRSKSQHGSCLGNTILPSIDLILKSHGFIDGELYQHISSTYLQQYQPIPGCLEDFFASSPSQQCFTMLKYSHNYIKVVMKRNITHCPHCI